MKSLPLLACLCLCTPAWTAPHLLTQSAEALDQQLAATLQSLSDGNIAEARVLAREAARRFPRSALAQLLAAELGASAAHRQVLAAGGAAHHDAPLQELLLEARARLHDRPSPDHGPLPEKLPTEVIQLGKAVSALLVVDLADSSMHHLAVNAGVPTLIQQHYVGSGKAGFDKRFEGDNKTPLGVYRITGYRSDASLPDLYGAGALTLNYPNALDRHLGRTGSGIWLHGVPHRQRSRSPRSSEGCVTMSNDHFNALYRRLSGDRNLLTQPPSSAISSAEPIVLLTHDVQWQEASARHREQMNFQTLFERYQRAWQAGDERALLDLYASPEQLQTRLQQTSTTEQMLPVLLGRVNKRDISIFHNPSLPGAGRGETARFMPVARQTGHARATQPEIVMHMRLGEAGEYHLSLYWGQNLHGQWQLLTEQWDSMSS
ncbi:L,D-transpeptidase family protein [Granulosicoccus sp. 3-233]|uniref:L,D-transpeptidase family protein n=1 Tax=Granulosicoccus sp. 3-233 TaxID=3417969 RepID=UPI003D353976